MRTHSARFVGAASSPSALPALGPPEVAFVGRSNVGKSSLLNALVGHKSLARVSKTPGRTQQINFFLVDDAIVFADLPGYGFARVPVELKDQWKQLAEGYLSARRQLCGVCVLVDIRRGVATDDRALLVYLDSLGLPYLLALTKADKLARGPRLQRARDVAASMPGVACVATSARLGEGVDELWDAIHAAAAAGAQPGAHEDR